jgi:hypothetical protein
MSIAPIPPELMPDTDARRMPAGMGIVLATGASLLFWAALAAAWLWA